MLCSCGKRAITTLRKLPTIRPKTASPAEKTKFRSNSGTLTFTVYPGSDVPCHEHCRPEQPNYSFSGEPGRLSLAARFEDSRLAATPRWLPARSPPSLVKGSADSIPAVEDRLRQARTEFAKNSDQPGYAARLDQWTDHTVRLQRRTT